MSPSSPLLRQCVHCRQLRPREALLWLTRSYPEQAIVIQNGPRTIQGRSAYVCREAGCLEASLKKHKLNRALKCLIPGDIVSVLTHELKGLQARDHYQSPHL